MEEKLEQMTKEMDNSEQARAEIKQKLSQVC